MINPQQTLSSMVKNWKRFPSSKEQEKGAHSHHCFNTVLEVLATAIRAEKEKKNKKESKLEKKK